MGKLKLNRASHPLSARCTALGMVLVLLLALEQAARAATIVVNSTADQGDNDVCVLRDAIAAADSQTSINGCSAGTGNDNIVFSVTGTILSNLLPTITDAHLTIIGPASPGIILSSSFSIDSGAMLEIDSLTIGLNHILNLESAIINDGSLIVRNCTFTRNNFINAANGGAINNAGALIVANSTFSKNVIFQNGGAIFNTGLLTISDSTFSNNAAGRGGAIDNDGVATITRSTFTGNRGPVRETRDYAGYGGAISNEGTLALINSTFSGNSIAPATLPGQNGSGGAIDNSGALLITNNTFSGNSAPYGDAISSSVSTAAINNSVFAQGVHGENCNGTMADQGYNISDDNSCGFSATGSQNNVNPELDPNGLQNNGGPTQTIALQHGSPAIDAIPLAQCIDQASPPNPITVDQRGLPRPDLSDNPAVCDIGAYELQARRSRLGGNQDR